MGGYVANFTVYTMAMIGLICFAVFVYKKIMDGSLGKKHTRLIEIEDTLSLNPRKTLHVVRAGDEQFLIAADTDRTTLISKLGNKYSANPPQNNDIKSTFYQTLESAQYSKRIPQANQRVHLEPICRKNGSIGISELRKAMDERAGQDFPQNIQPQRIQKVVATTQKNNSIAQSNIQKQQKIRTTIPSGSPMKEMAKKINEL